MKTYLRAATAVFPVLSLIALTAGQATRLPANSVIEPSQATPANHNIMLKVGHVEADRVTFSSLTPTRDIKVRESEFLKYYEVIIWEETASVHLYEFPNDFDSDYGYDIISVRADGTRSFRRNAVTDEQKIAYREQYLVKKYADMPEAWTNERSTFLKSAFMDVTTHLVNRHPISDHHLKYLGHGSPGGQLFIGQLQRDHANEFLKFWSETLGKPLGVIDMGGPCNKGSYADLDNFCDYARYYIASDLLNGGYSMDEFTWAKRDEVWPLAQYHDLFAANESLQGALRARIDLKRKAYEYSRENMVANGVAQANYLYSCEAFQTFSTAFESFLLDAGVGYGRFDDLYTYMVNNNAPPSLIEQFDDVIEYRADNRDFFEWSKNRNGMLMPDPVLLQKLEELRPRPFALKLISGDGQRGVSGTALDQPLIVEVRDQHGNPLHGATVTFTVSTGNGTLSVYNATTDENGRAATTLTLGNQPGASAVVARAADLDTVTFTATGADRADFDGDGAVGFPDFLQFAALFGLGQGDEQYDARFDLDGNGAIGFSDFLIFARAFGNSTT